MTIQCVEPAWVEEKGLPCVALVSVQEGLIFPHVDSCLAIAFILSDNRFVGGHVGQQMPPVPPFDLEKHEAIFNPLKIDQRKAWKQWAEQLLPVDNALIMTDEMLGKINDDSSKISKVVFLGDPGWNEGFYKQFGVQPQDLPEPIRLALRPALPEIRTRIKQRKKSLVRSDPTYLTLVKGNCAVDLEITRRPGLNLIAWRWEKTPKKRWKKLYKMAIPFINRDTEDNVPDK